MTLTRNEVLVPLIRKRGLALMSQEEQVRIFMEFLETVFLSDQLEMVRTHKEKLLKKLKSAEEYEEFLLEKIEEREAKKG